MLRKEADGSDVIITKQQRGYTPSAITGKLKVEQKHITDVFQFVINVTSS